MRKDKLMDIKNSDEMKETEEWTRVEKFCLKALAVWAVICAIVVTLFNTIFMLTTIPTGSMEHTIFPGDTLIGTRYDVGAEDLNRYDILVFVPPDKPDETYIKRLIGLPGETIKVKNGKVYADGVELDNSFIKGPQNRRGDGTYVVPEGCYFFLGDNRNNSRDSRFWKEKYVPLENIRAKAKIRVFPFSSAGSLE